MHQEQLPDLAEGVAAFYYLATGQVLDDKDGLGSMLSGLGFDKVRTQWGALLCAFPLPG